MTRNPITAAFLIFFMFLAACGSDTANNGGIANNGGGANNDGGANNGGETPSRISGYVTAERFSKLTVEVDFVSGYLPNEESENIIRDRLDALLDKPGGIEIVRDEELTSRGEDHVWTFEGLDALMDETNSLGVDDDTIKMHVAFVDGGYEEDVNGSRVLGLAWDHQNIVIFEETIRSACERPLLGARFCTIAEASIWTHEIGHVLGLVNNGAPLTAEHWDEEHGRHCTNQDCVMYWSYEGEQLLNLLEGRLTSGDDSAIGFGQDCLSDIDAVGTD